MSRSLKLDGHGKGYGAILLDMEIDAPPELAPVPTAEARAKPPNGGKRVRLGAAGGFETDRVDAAKDVIQSGEIDYDNGGIAQPVVGMYSTYLPRDAVKYEVRTLEVS